MKVARWGNSLALRLPKAIVEILALSEGDEIEVHVVGERSVEVERLKSRSELLKRLRKYRGSVPADFTFDREEAHERGGIR